MLQLFSSSFCLCIYCCFLSLALMCTSSFKFGSGSILWLFSLVLLLFGQFPLMTKSLPPPPTFEKPQPILMDSSKLERLFFLQKGQPNMISCKMQKHFNYATSGIKSLTRGLQTFTVEVESFTLRFQTSELEFLNIIRVNHKVS